jgi:hypothetical protein
MEKCPWKEARAFLAAVLLSALDMPEHWYAPKLIIPPASVNLLVYPLKSLSWSWKLLVLLLL